MKVREISEKFNLNIIAGENSLDREITGMYICDLLSWVMSHAMKGNAWITVQTHTNIVAVASLLDLSCIIIPEDIEVEEETIMKANEEEISLLRSSQSAYDIAKEFSRLIVGE